MTTLRTPVLTDEDIKIALAKAGFSVVVAGRYALEAGRAIEQTVLERAGADAVRDQALVRLMPEVLASLKYHGQDVSLVADIERALKGTPAAAVPDSMPGWSHWETRIKALMQDMGMPNSHSAYQALAQLANEMGQAHAAAAVPQAGQLSGNAGELDTARLNALGAASWGLVPESVATGGDDYDIAWKVISYHMDKPHEREVAFVVDDDPRAAIDAAIDAAIAAGKGAKP